MGNAVINFKQTDSDVNSAAQNFEIILLIFSKTLVRYWPSELSKDLIEKKLVDYFQLKYSLLDLCKAWGGEERKSVAVKGHSSVT